LIAVIVMMAVFLPIGSIFAFRRFALKAPKDKSLATPTEDSVVRLDETNRRIFPFD
jgi:hypothetical protein